MFVCKKYNVFCESHNLCYVFVAESGRRCLFSKNLISLFHADVSFKLTDIFLTLATILFFELENFIRHWEIQIKNKFDIITGKLRFGLKRYII